MKHCITGCDLAQAIGGYLCSKRVAESMAAAFKELEENEEQKKKLCINAKTAPRWLKKMEFAYSRFQKGVYVD